MIILNLLKKKNNNEEIKYFSQENDARLVIWRHELSECVVYISRIVTGRWPFLHITIDKLWLIRWHSYFEWFLNSYIVNYTQLICRKSYQTDQIVENKHLVIQISCMCLWYFFSFLSFCTNCFYYYWLIIILSILLWVNNSRIHADNIVLYVLLYELWFQRSFRCILSCFQIFLNHNSLIQTD